MKTRSSSFPVALVVAVLASGCGSGAEPAEASAAARAAVAATATTWDSDLINIERVGQDGTGVYVAVLDTGLVPSWRDYFPADRVATQLGTGFEQAIAFRVSADDPCRPGVEVGALKQTTWVGSTGSTHGTHVTSTILGYGYFSNFDQGVLPPLFIRGIAQGVKIIPVKVLADYQVPARPQCTDPDAGDLTAHVEVFGTEAMVAAGIDYVTGLARRGVRPIVINMSLGSGPQSTLSAVEKAAIDRAIAAGVVVVASAGNDGEAGMGFPGAYRPVISAGSAGWTKEWLTTGGVPRTRFWWVQSTFNPYNDIPEPTPAGDVYVSDFSSRETRPCGDAPDVDLTVCEQLDVLAPGSWVRGPFPGDPGFAHLPWWSAGIGDLRGGNPSNFFYVGGTSMAAPHVTSVAALMLQKSPALVQADVERLIKQTALPIPPSPAGGVQVFDFDHFAQFSWGANATGAGLVQADAAVLATP